MHALVLREVVFLARLDVEGRVPRVEIARRAIGTELSRAVLVGEYLRPQRAVAILRPPDLSERKEEPLIAGESVEHWRGLAPQRDVIGLVGDRQSGEICDVLAQSERAVDVKAGQRFV